MLNVFTGEQEPNTKGAKSHEAYEEASGVIPSSTLGLSAMLVFMLFVTLVLFGVEASLRLWQAAEQSCQ